MVLVTEVDPPVETVPDEEQPVAVEQEPALIVEPLEVEGVAVVVEEAVLPDDVEEIEPDDVVVVETPLNEDKSEFIALSSSKSAESPEISQEKTPPYPFESASKAFCLILLASSKVM